MMTIGELSDIIGCDLIIKRHANQNGRYTAEFERTEVKNYKESSVMVRFYGNGGTPEEAVSDYVEKIRGKWLVINAMDEEKRREFGVPHTLTVGW